MRKSTSFASSWHLQSSGIAFPNGKRPEVAPGVLTLPNPAAC